MPNLDHSPPQGLVIPRTFNGGTEAMLWHTVNGNEVDLSKTGCKIVFDISEDISFPTLEIWLHNSEAVGWPGDNDNKMPAPHCVRNKKDFCEIVILIANLLGLKVSSNQMLERGPLKYLVWDLSPKTPEADHS